jgi:hypothetical protein
LCGGDHDKTRDLTQDTWVKLVDELNRGHLDRVDVRWAQFASTLNRFYERQLWTVQRWPVM